MPNSYFRFKKFTIHHDRCAMKVGTDGVLTGAWANHPAPQRILDIGTGSGLMALMMAQRFENAAITGIEIDPEAAAQAAENVAESIFNERVSVVNTSLQDFTGDENFDLVVCNPPFFKTTSTSASETRNTARQTGKLTPEDIFAFSAKRLTDNGRIALIFPAETDLESTALFHHLYLLRKTVVKGTENSVAKRILWEFGKTCPSVPVTGSLVIEISRNHYTDAFVSLVNNFYLHH